MQRQRKTSVAARLLTPLLAWACCATALVTLATLAGCGQKGSLSLPPPPAGSAASAPAR